MVAPRRRPWLRQRSAGSSRRITEQFQDRQLSTERAFDEIQKLVDEQKRAQDERAKLGMDAPRFGVYEAKVASAKELKDRVRTFAARVRVQPSQIGASCSTGGWCSSPPTSSTSVP